MSRREDELVELTIYLLERRPVFEFFVTNTSAKRTGAKQCEVTLQLGQRRELRDGFTRSTTVPDDIDRMGTKLYLTAFLNEVERGVALELKRTESSSA